jgi:anti-sigma B factor antagonist
MAGNDAPPHHGRRAAAPVLTVTLSRPRADAVVCTVIGEVDLATAPLLLERLQQACSDGARHLVVDLSGVTFFAAAGVGVLHEARAAQAPTQELLLVGKDRLLLRVLDVCAVGYRRYCHLDHALAACEAASSR